MYYVLFNKYKIPVPYWTWADAQKAIQTIYRAQYPDFIDYSGKISASDGFFMHFWLIFRVKSAFF